MLIRWQKTIVDRQGNIQPGAVLTIRRESDQALVTIYRDRDGTNAYPTGTVTADENGYAYFYAMADTYRITSLQPAIDWRDEGLVTAVIDFAGKTYVTVADMEADTSQPVGTLGRVSTGEGAGDYVMTATGWVWSDVQPASGTKLLEAEQDIVKAGETSTAQSDILARTIRWGAYYEGVEATSSGNSASWVLDYVAPSDSIGLDHIELLASVAGSFDVVVYDQTGPDTLYEHTRKTVTADVGHNLIPVGLPFIRGQRVGILTNGWTGISSTGSRGCSYQVLTVSGRTATISPPAGTSGMGVSVHVSVAARPPQILGLFPYGDMQSLNLNASPATGGRWWISDKTGPSGADSVRAVEFQALAEGPVLVGLFNLDRATNRQQLIEFSVVQAVVGRNSIEVDWPWFPDAAIGVLGGVFATSNGAKSGVGETWRSYVPYPADNDAVVDTVTATPLAVGAVFGMPTDLPIKTDVLPDFVVGPSPTQIESAGEPNGTFGTGGIIRRGYLPEIYPKGDSVLTSVAFWAAQATYVTLSVVSMSGAIATVVANYSVPIPATGFNHIPLNIFVPAGHIVTVYAPAVIKHWTPKVNADPVFMAYPSLITDTSTAAVNTTDGMNVSFTFNSASLSSGGNLSSTLAGMIGAYEVSSRYRGKEVYLFGDSITTRTWSNGYMDYIAEITGCNIFTYGRGGAADDYIVDQMGIPGLAPRQTWTPTYPAPDFSIPAAVLIQVGTNKQDGQDYGSGSLADIPVETLSDLPYTVGGVTYTTPAEHWSRYPDNYYGNLAICLEYIQSQNQEARIYLITPPPCALRPGVFQNVPPAMLELGALYGVPVLQSHIEAGIPVRNSEPYLESDRTHPTAIGMRLIGSYIGYRMLAT